MNSAPVCLVLCELTWRKLADVVADTDQHAGCFQVVSSLHMDLQKNTKKGKQHLQSWQRSRNALSFKVFLCQENSSRREVETLTSR